MQEIFVEILFSALNLCKILVVDGAFADFSYSGLHFKLRVHLRRGVVIHRVNC